MKMIAMMKYYKDKDNIIYAYDAYGTQDSFIKDGLVLITRSEARAIINPPLTKEQEIVNAEQRKNFLINFASSVIQPLADAKAGGYIVDLDIPKLEEWQRYRYALTKVDTSNAPDVIFPTAPSE
ncbi:tail fiber assembly protein [Citrobacter sp. A316]|uniref:tail fiber assembly protein n=1 Tax=Citrobacter sp. A316 TaxID=1639132 RepID=UPI0009AC1595|nr:tail fiber assembly protein [Citrobacter sp. A316]